MHHVVKVREHLRRISSTVWASGIKFRSSGLMRRSAFTRGPILAAFYFGILRSGQALLVWSWEGVVYFIILSHWESIPSRPYDRKGIDRSERRRRFGTSLECQELFSRCASRSWSASLRHPTLFHLRLLCCMNPQDMELCNVEPESCPSHSSPFSQFTYCVQTRSPT